MRLYSKVLAVLLAVFALTTAAAQTGAIRVRVIDASDKTPLPGVTVVLRNSMQYVATTTVLTNRDGIAEFPVLRAGSGYSLEVSFPGYAKQIQTGLKVPISQVLQVGFALSPEMVEREVVVGKRETVDLEKSSHSTKFGDDFIQDLPVQGRFYQNVLTMAAGVQDADGDGNPNVHGARSRDFKAQVDGVSNQDPLTGYQMSQVNPDSIEEIEVITAGAGVEFGRAQGGFANIIQKQGSNDFEGTFNFLFRSSLLDGNAVALPGEPRPEYQLFQPAIQVSGPILRDKLWYRLSHEFIRQDDPVVTYEGTATVRTDQQISSDALTWQVSPRNKLQFTYSADPRTVKNWGVSRLTPASSSRTQETGGPLYRINWTAPFSAKVLFDSVVSYQDSRVKIGPSTVGVKNNCVVSKAVDGESELPFIEDALCVNLETGQTSGSFFMNYDDHRQRMTLKSTASIFGGRFWGMDHQFKVGLSVENERYFRKQERRPNVYFYELTMMNSNQSATLERLAIVAGTFAVPELTTTRGTGTATGVFFEDVMKPRQNLSITLGLRIDREALNARGFKPFDPAAEEEAYYTLREQYALEEAAKLMDIIPGLTLENALPLVYASDSAGATIELPASKGAFTAYEGIDEFATQLGNNIENADVDLLLGTIIKSSKEWDHKRQAEDLTLSSINLGPHVAISWDPWSDGKTKFGFSARRLYGATPLVIALAETEPATTQLRFQSVRTGGDWETSMATGVNPAITVSVVDRGYTTPYNDEMTLSVEREVFAETALKFTYVYRQFRNQPQDFDLNHYPADYGRCKTQLVALAPLPGWMEVAYDSHGRPIGDGIVDDCDGELEMEPTDPEAPPTDKIKDFSTGFVHRPDGYLDTYTHNLGWSSIYLVGNFNDAVYRAYQLELTRRQYRNWQMNASYTFSKAVGDAEDWNSALGDDRTTREDERGYLSYDVRHALKINATTITPWGFRAGTAVSWQTGLPYSILLQASSQDSTPPSLLSLGQPEPRYRQKYVTHQRNDQRNRPYWNFDVKLDKEMNLGKGMNLQVAVDIFNLLNDRTYVIWNPFSEQGIQLNGSNEAYRRAGRQYQLSAKLSF